MRMYVAQSIARTWRIACLLLPANTSTLMSTSWRCRRVLCSVTPVQYFSLLNLIMKRMMVHPYFAAKWMSQHHLPV